MKSLKQILYSRYGGMCVFGAVFMLINFVVRVSLLCLSWGHAAHSVLDILQVFAGGLFFDLNTLLYIITGFAFFTIFVTDKSLTKKFNRINALVQYFGLLCFFIFAGVAEFFFWDEFTSRFNFIAVDYLVYTQEVVNNIWQSYPIVWVFVGIGVVAVVLFVLSHRHYSKGFAAKTHFLRRAGVFAILCVLSIGSIRFVDNSTLELSENRITNELSKNGIYSFFSAFRQNKLSYEDFYLTIDNDRAFELLHKEYGINQSVSDADKFSIQRQVKGAGAAKAGNVVMIVVESLSAKFLGYYGDTNNLTPKLDKLIGQSLVFTNLYATGTRTTRGLEAVTLSLPPTPGRSLVKRPDNAGLFSLGTIFNDKGYQCQFLYGGRGFFDNMNSFYAGNGFDVLDQSDFASDEVTFSNAWGVCDGDLFNKTLTECDKTYSSGKKFVKLIMTTSNHRPYTHPELEGIETGTRFGAVKYTDYAIGQFIEQARKKDWFDDTVFVIVADHCGNSAGKRDLEIGQYHIPLIIYGPSFVKPAKVDTLCSQMDVGPTVLGLFGFDYQSHFFGKDIVNDPPNRALVGNYQRLGLYDGKRLYVLLPGQRFEAFSVGSNLEETLLEGIGSDDFTDAVMYYQCAGYMIRHFNDK